MHWEVLLRQPSFDLRRSGRFLVADLKAPHQVLSTSVRHGGQVDHVAAPCEPSELRRRCASRSASSHDRGRSRRRITIGLRRGGLPADDTAIMGTAANMNYVAMSTESDDA